MSTPTHGLTYLDEHAQRHWLVGVHGSRPQMVRRTAQRHAKGEALRNETVEKLPRDVSKRVCANKGCGKDVTYCGHAIPWTPSIP